MFLLRFCDFAVATFIFFYFFSSFFLVFYFIFIFFLTKKILVYSRMESSFIMNFACCPVIRLER